MSDWRCGTCHAVNDEAAVVCEVCAGAVVELIGPAKWLQRCPEPGCTLTVGEHRDEVRRALALINQRQLNDPRRPMA